jgi:hypothetical protein
VLHFASELRLCDWCDRHKLGQLVDIEPLHVAAYIEGLGKDFEKPTVKQFDWLVTGGSGGLSTLSNAARRLCSPPTRPARCSTA